MKDWYMEWEREKEDREEELHQAHLERIRQAEEQLQLRREPKTDKRGQLLLPLEA